MTDAKSLAVAYVAALSAGEPERVLALFADDAIVVSPLFGTRPARAFFGTLTTPSDVVLREAFVGIDDPAQLALRVDWNSQGPDGGPETLSVVDVLTLDHFGRIARLETFYDTAEIRQRLGTSVEAINALM